MADCWDCVMLEPRCGGFQYCLRNGGRRNVDANRDRCSSYQIVTKEATTAPLSQTQP
jgi:hypothetical protein